MDNNSLFYRSIEDQSKYKLFIKSVQSDFFDLNNWTKDTIYNLYNKNYEKEFLLFRFEILKKWCDSNFFELELIDFYNQLITYINILKLNEYLYANEQNFLYKIKQNLFLSSKQIKLLATPFSLNKNEKAFYKFNEIYLLNNKINKKLFFEEIYITNQRIVLINNLYICWFNLNNLSWKLDNDKISVIYYKNQYILKSNDLFEIKYGLKNIKK